MKLYRRRFTNLEELREIVMQKYTLEGMIKFDEAYFTVESSEVEKQKCIQGKEL